MAYDGNWCDEVLVLDILFNHIAEGTEDCISRENIFNDGGNLRQSLGKVRNGCKETMRVGFWLRGGLLGRY